MQRGIGSNTFNDKFVERTLHPFHCGLSIVPVGNDFRDQGVVKRWHRIAIIDVGINSYTYPTGRMETFDGTGRGQESLLILGVDSTLERMPRKCDITLSES